MNVKVSEDATMPSTPRRVGRRKRQEHLCTVCGKIFPLKKLAEQCGHLKETEDDLGRVCEVCGRRLPSEAALQRHRDSAHPDCNETLENIESNVRAGSFSCPHCSKAFKSSAALDRHCSRQHASLQNSQSSSKDGEEKRALSRSLSFKDHKQYQTSKSFRCQNCGQMFKSKTFLQHHEVDCQGQRHSCSICHRDFASAKILRSHCQTHVKSCVCKFCSRSFTNNYSLKNHMRSHTGEHPYLCDKCPLVFKTAAQLRCHRQLLHNTRPKVPEESSLMEYEDTPTGVKVKFSCKSCLKIFTSVTAFKIHERYHAKDEKLTCKICGKVLGHTGSLKSHMKIHRNERAFVCEFCGKGFIENSELRRHRLIHTGERPHKCEICGRGFTQSYSLKNHLRTHVAGTANYCHSCRRNFRSASSLQKHNCVPILRQESENLEKETSGSFAGMRSREEFNRKGDHLGIGAGVADPGNGNARSCLGTLSTVAALCGPVDSSLQHLSDSSVEMEPAAASMGSSSVVSCGQRESQNLADAGPVAEMDSRQESALPEDMVSVKSCIPPKPGKFTMKQTPSKSLQFTWTNPHLTQPLTHPPTHPSTHPLTPSTASSTAPPSPGLRKMEPPEGDTSLPNSIHPPPHPLLRQLLPSLTRTLPESMAKAAFQAVAKTVPEVVRVAVGEAVRETVTKDETTGQPTVLGEDMFEELAQKVNHEMLGSLACQLPQLLTSALTEEVRTWINRHPPPSS